MMRRCVFKLQYVGSGTPLKSSISLEEPLTAAHYTLVL